MLFIYIIKHYCTAFCTIGERVHAKLNDFCGNEDTNLHISVFDRQGPRTTSSYSHMKNDLT